MTAAVLVGGRAGVLVVLVRCLVGLVGRGLDALARRRQAELRAEALLLSWLSPSQRAQSLERGWS